MIKQWAFDLVRSLYNTLGYASLETATTRIATQDGVIWSSLPNNAIRSSTLSFPITAGDNVKFFKINENKYI